MAHAAQENFGKHAGNYRILGEAGVGGMGKVFKAFDVTLRRTVALKFLTPVQGVADRDRILREARAASTLDHKNIATIHAVEESDDGQLFIVMPYYDGETLAAHMRREVSSSEVINILVQIAQGLSYAHAHCIVHRDIKPSNIIITRDGVAKIVDFGLARSTGTDATTQTMNISGTLAYMSPEQVSGKAVDARTDIWSFGVLMYELLTRQLPFHGENAGAAIAAILHSPPSDMVEVPPELQSIVYKAMAKRPEERYQNCTELLCDLEEVKTVELRPPSGAVERLVRRHRSAVLSSSRFSLRRLMHGAVWVVPLVVLVLSGALYVRRTIASRAQQGGESSNQIGQTSSARTAAYQSYLRGLTYLRRYDQPKNIDAAIPLLEGTIKTDPNFALAFVALGEAYWDKYRLDQDARWFDKASAYCQRAAELNSNLPAVYVMLARIHNGSGQNDLALQEVERALQLDRRNADAILALADVYASTGRVAEAEEAYRRAAASRPNDWDGRYRLAVFYYRQHRYADAAQQFRRVVEMVPDHAPAHTNLGVMLRHLGQEAEAESNFKTSIALNPSYAAFANLGDLYYRQKRYAESAKMTDNALRLNQEDYRVWTNLAIAYERLGRSEKAARAYDSALEKLKVIAPLKADDPAIQAELGLIYAKKHMKDKALPALEAAVALSPEDGEVWGDIAEGYYLLGEQPQAIDCIRQALAKGWTLRDVDLIPGLRAMLSDPRIRRQLRAPETPKVVPNSLR